LREPVAPRQLEFPYYTLRDGFNSTLLLVGASAAPLDFIIAVRSASGRTVLSPSMTIQSGEKLSVDLRVLLTELGVDVNGDFAEGSVSIYFNGTIMPLAGQLTMSNPARSLVLESEMVDNSPGLGLLPSALNAVWWGLGGGREARFTASNTSGDPVTADVYLDFQGERHESAPLAFAPHETKILSITHLLGELKVSPAQAPEGGISIIGRGSIPALIAQGKITDPNTGFSTTLNFPDPKLQRASALHASGVPIGLPSKESPYAGAGVFVPHVIVRNLTGAPQSVTITVEYPGEDGPAQATPPPLALEAYTTKDIPLDLVLASLPLPLPFCSIRIQYSGAPGSVIGEVSSIEAKGDLVIDSRLANERDGWVGSGAHPWHLDEETESILFLTNMSEKSARIGFDMVAGGVHYYLTRLKLKPHETRAIDLRKVRDEQKPDLKGNKVPAGATDGSVVWTRLDHVPVMGRLVVLQRHNRIASGYDCHICDCDPDFFDLYVTPASYIFLPDRSVLYDALAWFREHCNQYEWLYNVDASFQSLNPPVATVTTEGTATGQSGGTATIKALYTEYYYIYDHVLIDCIDHPRQRTGYATAKVVTVSISGPANVPLRAAGSSGPNTINLTATGTPSGGSYSWSTTSSKVTLSNTTSATVTVTSASASTAVADVPVKVTYTYSGTSNTATQNISVVRPTSLNKTSDNTNPTGHTCDPNATQNTCQQSHFNGGGSYASYVGNITYDIMDQFSPPRPIKGFALQNSESYTQPSGPCAGDPIIVGQPSSGDTLIDCFYFCSETCRTGGSCNVSATQTIKSNGFVVATKGITWTCSGASVP